MPVLGIIACRALEDELAHVLSEDHELRHLILINDLECFGLSEKLRSKKRPHLLAAREDVSQMLNDIDRTGRGILKPLLDRSRLLYGIFGKVCSSGDEIIIVVNILKMALHLDSKLLRAEVCMDDCIAAAVEGNRQYTELLSDNPGVGVYCTPMWASILDYGDRETKRYNIEHHWKPKGLGDNLKDLGFSKIARLDTGLKFISDFNVESMVNGFAKSYNLGIVELHGNAKIAERCYRQAKDVVNCSDRKSRFETKRT